MAMNGSGSLLAAIAWAQWRSFANLRAGEGGLGRLGATALALVWYSLWSLLALGACVLLQRASRAALEAGLGWVLVAVFAYWQLAPLVTASLGVSLDLRKLAVYPISERSLFVAELLLRLVTAPEMPLVLAGMVFGLLRNPQVPWWSPVPALAWFAFFNLLVGAGLRGLLERVFARRIAREVAALLLVLAAASPQLLLLPGVPDWLHNTRLPAPGFYTPWARFARLGLGRGDLEDLIVVALWSVAGYAFARIQFRRLLRGEHYEAGANQPAFSCRAGRRWLGPGRLASLLKDPLALIVEKELLSLVRSPRLRLVFLMGFSFGFLVCLPLARYGTVAWENYPVLVSVYAVLLLADVLFWNAFGFDRSAAQLWFAAPLPLRCVLVGKNVAGGLIVLIEVSVVVAVCALVGLPLRAGKLVETYVVGLTFCLYLLAAGNLASVRFPRPVDPAAPWSRGNGARFQLLALIVYPVLGFPIVLAYWVRYALGSQAAFSFMLALAAGLGVLLYRAWLQKAVLLAATRRDLLLRALTRSGDPVLLR